MTNQNTSGTDGTLDGLFSVSLPGYADRAVVRYDDGTRYRTVNGNEYRRHFASMAAHLDRADGRQLVVATLAKNRPEFDMVSLASLYLGHILSPLDPKMDDDELRHLLGANPPDVVLVSLNQRNRLHDLLGQVGLAPEVLVADRYAVYEDREEDPARELQPGEVSVSAITAVEAEMPPPAAADTDRTVARYATSGTTSLPKVVSITRRNVEFQLAQALDMINLRRNEDVLSIGPYTHIATLLEFLVSKTKRFTVSYFTRDAEDDGVLEAEIKKLKRQGVRIRCLMAVPKFWNYVLKEILEELSEKPVFRNLYRHLISIEKSDHFYDIGTLDKAKLVAARTLLRNKLGGYFAYGISSSTKVEPGVIEIFAKLGITIIDVYGATEASGVIARNSLNESRSGFCGRLLDGFEYRLTNQRILPGIPHPVGDLHLKGSGIAAGYMNPDNAFPLDDEGYYNTGDVAFVDEERWVYLVGRRVEQITWNDGQMTDPMRVSNLLVRSIWIRDGLVVRTENDDSLSVFVLPDYKRIEKSETYRKGLEAGLSREQVIRPMLEEAIRYAQSLLGDFPRLSMDRIYLLARKLERTPTHKIKLAKELARLEWSSYI